MRIVEILSEIIVRYGVLRYVQVYTISCDHHHHAASNLQSPSKCVSPILQILALLVRRLPPQDPIPVRVPSKPLDDGPVPLLKVQVQLAIVLGRLGVCLHHSLRCDPVLVSDIGLVAGDVIFGWQQALDVAGEGLILLHRQLVQVDVLRVHQRHVEPAAAGEPPANLGPIVGDAALNRLQRDVAGHGVKVVEDDG